MKRNAGNPGDFFSSSLSVARASSRLGPEIERLASYQAYGITAVGDRGSTHSPLLFREIFVAGGQDKLS